MKNSTSQAGQDSFVMHCLKNKRNGIFVELGSNDPMYHSNTYSLEKEYGWNGLMVDYQSQFVPQYIANRSSPYIIADACKIDYKKVFEEISFPHAIDYLQIDLEVNNKSTINCLEVFDKDVFPSYKFAVVTFEHDIYRGDFFNTRQKSREIFDKNGYVLVYPDVKNQENAFEDWYVHPDLVDMDYMNNFITDESIEWQKILWLFITYNPYINVINKTNNLQPEEWYFKSDPQYQGVLEHVSQSDGNAYWDHLKKEFPDKLYQKDKFITLAHTNDSLGKPTKFDIKDFTNCSPTNLRYLYHAFLILQLIKKYQNNVDIVEIGGGYGGLAFYLRHLCELFEVEISSHTIIDLESVANLQKTYTNYLGIEIDSIPYVKCDTFNRENCFLVSAYALAEFPVPVRERYTETVTCKCNHGFLVWNTAGDQTPFNPAIVNGKEFVTEPERPLTGAGNYFITY